MVTTTIRGLALAAGLVWCVAAAAGDDPPPDRLERKPKPAEQKAPDPPDRLERKPKPPEAPDAKSKAPADDKAGSQPKKLKRPDDGPDRTTEPPEDPEKLRERIARDMQSAEEKLKAHDPGAETQRFQDRALKNLEKLLDQARNPPPSDQQQQQQQSQQSKGKMGGRPKNGQQQAQNLSRREQRQQRRQQMARTQQRPDGQRSQDQDMQDPQGTGANPPLQGGFTGVGKVDRLADVAKDIWGHLPETLRQEVDHYYRDQFMPRYRELLQQYYSRLAEQERRARDGR
jgi:hypothetical protein